MITEEDRVKQTKEQLKEEIARHEFRILKAEPYERILTNADYKKILEDYQEIIKLHDEQVNLGLDSLAVKTDHHERLNLANFVVAHRIRKQQLAELIARGNMIVKNAQESREALPELREKLADLEQIKLEN